jgi:hypothetical protein
MGRMHLSIAFLVSASVPCSAGEPVSKSPDIQPTIKRGLEFLAKDSLAWKNERHCASCHHAPMMIWSLNEAKNRGHAVDEKALAEVTSWILSPDDPAKVFPKQTPKDPLPAVKPVRQTPLMLALAFASIKAPDKKLQADMDRFVLPLVEDQAADGSWSLPGGGRPPMVDAKEVMTMWTLLALDAANRPTPKNAPESGALDKGIKWLAQAQRGDSHQTAVLQILFEHKRGKNRQELQPLVDALIKRQNPDGGWSQTKEMASDGYATGQSLYALGLLGFDPREKSVERAHAFLAKTQEKDGSWKMESRPMKAGEKGSKNTVPITYAGSAWATMGLIRTSPALGLSQNK